MRLALVTVLIASLGVVVTGDLQARLMTEQQPMKMAAAEALYDTVAPASFSLFTIGSLDGSQESLEHPRPRRAVVHGHRLFDGQVEGINDLQAAEQAAVRSRRLPAGHPVDLLDVPADDRLRLRSAVLLSLRRPVAHPPRPDPAGAALVLPGRDRRRSPCRSRPTASAGSSPRWAASPGRCSGCCQTADGVSPRVRAGAC